MPAHTTLIDHIAIAKFTRRVRMAYNIARGDINALCSFHLGRCHCGAPVWQQPCPICRYYPANGSTGTTAAPNSCTKERYVALAERHGGIAAWYFAGYRNTGAYAKQPGFARMIDELVEDAKTWTDVPSAAEIWDHFHAD
jgi:hypothetical protein